MDWKWRRLEKDWRWTDCGLEVDSMDEIGTGGGLHEDPWGSVRYRVFVWTRNPRVNNQFTILHRGFGKPSIQAWLRILIASPPKPGPIHH